MNDFEKLKQLFEKISATKVELKKITDEINKAFFIFEDMNYDCDDEIDEIDEKIDELTEKLEEKVEKEIIQSRIDELIKKKGMVQEAAEILNKLEDQFDGIQDIVDEIDVEI